MQILNRFKIKFSLIQTRMNLLGNRFLKIEIHHWLKVKIKFLRDWGVRKFLYRFQQNNNIQDYVIAVCGESDFFNYDSIYGYSK